MLVYLQNIKMLAAIRKNEAREVGKSCINFYSASEELVD